MNCNRPNVIIVGAGIAGLAAAYTLQKSGKVDVCVLEGSERIGGRIHTIKINGQIVELGAEWLHGTRNNLLKDLCDSNDIRYEEFCYQPDGDNSTDDPSISVKLYSFEGKEIDDSIVQEVAYVADELMRECDKFASLPEIKVNQYHNSVGKCLWDGFDSFLANSDPSEAKLKSRVFDWLLRDECVNCAVDSLDQLNLISYGDYIGYEDKNFTVCRGFSAVLEVLCQILPPETIFLKHEVTRINWTDIKVTSKNTNPVTVTCTNGKMLTADHVIITSSLGVLKERVSSLFCPALPHQKLEAIDKLGFGTINKIILEFEKPLWLSEICNGVGFLSNCTPNLHQEISENKKIPEWISHLVIFHPHAKRSSILTGWLVGSANLEIENIPTEEIGNQCLKLLSKLPDINISKLLRVERSCWYGNPLTRGSYTYIPVNANGSMVDQLAAPVPDESVASFNLPQLQLLFAGEATNRKLYASAHGAFLSGIREARRILKNLAP